MLSNNSNHYHVRILIALFILLIIGAILFLTGLALFLSKRKGIDVLIVGCIMLLPGVYATQILIGTYLGWRGYDYGTLPSFEWRMKFMYDNWFYCNEEKLRIFL